MVASFFNKLATETRLQIYAEVLRSHGPVEHIQSIIADKDTRGILRRVRGVHTAILRVSRQAHNEALPVFYECNTVVIRHTTLCRSSIRQSDSVTLLHCDHRLVRNVHVRIDNDKTCPDACRCDTEVMEKLRVVDRFVMTNCPKLKTITLPLPYNQYYSGSCMRGDHKNIGLSEHLRLNGFIVSCTTVGRFEVTLPGSSHSFVLHDDEMIQTWRDRAQAVGQDLKLLTLDCRKDTVGSLVHQLMLGLRNGWSTSDARELLRIMNHTGYLEMEWLEMGVQDGHVLESITDGLARWMWFIKR
ncbi:hypothetical protein LTR56_013648 [Elasticomyces elasticus]|nr:hypothetical protein LTR22_023719 [Elasticomyces elasticus]KAK3637475.1 hypothetical protein LTR56_013648 [Elasticomyces elasticus]KAK4917866.1 hypothetical protein LTR49_014270 [Elasticomyces elasticus]KAK5757025.1 hypothetical protein LTS12_012839 [Elasticomyces elasticus]